MTGQRSLVCAQYNNEDIPHGESECRKKLQEWQAKPIQTHSAESFRAELDDAVAGKSTFFDLIAALLIEV